jgi:hypothetical protein
MFDFVFITDQVIHGLSLVWGMAVFGFLLFVALLLIDTLLLIMLTGPTLEKYMFFRKKHYKPEKATNDLLALVNKHGKCSALIEYALAVLCYIGLARFLYVITFNK